MRFAVVVATLLVATARVASAQQTAADTAGVILNTARRIEREGRVEVARELLRFLRLRYSGTPAAREADSLLAAMPRPTSGSGRTGFVLFNTLYGGFLGVAVPAALSANGSEPYGAGLLIGAPLGYFGARAFSKARFKSAGQAGVASFATAWGTWQGLALQQAARLGDKTECGQFGCFKTSSDEAPWVAMMIGGVAGLGTGWALAASKDIAPGTSTLISHSAFWGNWFGLSLGIGTGLRDRDLFWSQIAAGNAGLLLAIPASRSWRPSSARVRLITAGGVAGALVGFGVDLLASVEGDAVMAIPAGTSAIGLIVGALATANRRDLDQAQLEPTASGALVDATNGFRLGVPVPIPTSFEVGKPNGGLVRKPGVRVVLFQGRL